MVLLSACKNPPVPASGPELLDAAHRALGIADTVRTILTVAKVESPSGGFDARIASATDGRVQLTMGSSLVAGVEAGIGWSCDAGGTVAPLDSVTRSVVRGHDLHMLIVSPRWMSAPVRQADGRWGADSVMSLRFTDELGAPLLMHLRIADSMPVGLDVVNHTGSGPREVRVVFDDWQQHGGVRLFRRATFEHGGNRFVYHYTEPAINTLADSSFRPACVAKGH
jgi:hypothetical protein